MWMFKNVYVYIQWKSKKVIFKNWKLSELFNMLSAF